MLETDILIFTLFTQGEKVLPSAGYQQRSILQLLLQT